MQFLHLIEDEKGISRFADVEIALKVKDFAPPAQPMGVSESENCERFLFLSLPPGWGGKQHPSPCRQMAFCLSGRMKVTAGDGDIREVGPGDIWRMEDTNGAGHFSEVIGDEAVRLAVVQLD